MLHQGLVEEGESLYLYRYKVNRLQLKLGDVGVTILVSYSCACLKIARIKEY